MRLGSSCFLVSDDLNLYFSFCFYIVDACSSSLCIHVFNLSFYMKHNHEIAYFFFFLCVCVLQFQLCSSVVLIHSFP